MPPTMSREPHIRQAVSLRKSQLEDVKRVVIEEERHGNLSRYIQDLIDADLKRRAFANSETEKEAAA